MFSITETAKANNLNPYWYMKHVLEELLKHQDEEDNSYLDELLLGLSACQIIVISQKNQFQ